MSLPGVLPTNYSWTQRRAHPLLRHAGMSRLRTLSSGNERVRLALIDGPICIDHPSLKGARIEQVYVSGEGPTWPPGAVAHATFLASMFVGSGDFVLGMCPNCELLNICIVDGDFERRLLPAKVAATRIKSAILLAVQMHANVIQLSLEFLPSGGREFDCVADALAFAARCGVRTVVAAGNTPTLGPRPVLGAAGAIPVGVSDRSGSPHPLTPLGTGIGLRGFRAPGTDVPGAECPDSYGIRSGSSYATSFVTASFCLLQSVFPNASSDAIWAALLGARRERTFRSVVPPELDADTCLRDLEGGRSDRFISL